MVKLGQDTKRNWYDNQNWPVLTRIGADSLMIARAAERNPSIFLPKGPRCNITEVIPRLLNLAQQVNNPWGNTKFLLNQFKPSPPPISNLSKAEKKQVQEAVNRSKSIEEVSESLQIPLGRGLEVMAEVRASIEEKPADTFEERHVAEHRGQVLEQRVNSPAGAGSNDADRST